MVDYSVLTNLTRDELLEEYCKLFDRFHDLHESNEKDVQKIHELKRSLDTATAAQAYLSQELEQYTILDNKETENELHKTKTELLDMKRKYSKLEATHASIEQDYNTLLEENAEITKNLKESQKSNQQFPCEDDGRIKDDLMRNEFLENENMGLLQKIEDFEESSVRYTLAIAEREKIIEILTDQLTCMEENLKSKRVELEEKIQIIESTQEQLAEANAKIAMLSSAPDNNDRKGNSLFAEVDDQRQAMKQRLVAQKKSYMQMKKMHNESEDEIRRLKRENISMRTEFETCSEIFCKADKIYQEKLNERIRCLLNQNEEFERKLKWTQERLKELAADKGVLFLDSMLSFCKKETDDLKSQLHRVRLQNASLEEQLRNAQQDMARWRFESLKSRCILIDRENLLTENKITFKPIHAIEYNVSEEDLKEAKPRIVSTRRSILENITNRKSITPSKLYIQPNTTSPQQYLKKDNENFVDINIKKELMSDSVEQNTIPCENEKQTSVQERGLSEFNNKIKTEIDASSAKKSESFSITNNKDLCNEGKENSIICLDDTSTFDNFANLRANLSFAPTPMRKSPNSLERQPETTTTYLRPILTKHDLLTNSCKQVKFSSGGDTVHNISSTTVSPDESTTAIKTDDDSVNEEIKVKNNTEKKRTKSNIVVRRFVLGSKHD